MLAQSTNVSSSPTVSSLQQIYAETEKHPGLQKPSRDADGYLAKWILVAFFSWALFGKKLMVVPAVWFNVPSRLLTVPSHAATVGLSLCSIAVVVLVATHFRRFPLHWSVVPFFLFWGFYSLTLYSDFLLMGAPGGPEPGTNVSPDYIAQKAFGTCLLSSFAVLINHHWGSHLKSRDICFSMSLAMAVAFLVMYHDNILHFESRMNPGEEAGDHTTVSSLSLGYSGLVLLSFVLNRLFSGHRIKLWKVAFWLAVSGTGLLLIVGSASRGPVVVFLFMLIPFGASLFARGQKSSFLKLILVSVTAAFAAIIVAESTGSIVFSRVFSMVQDVEQQSDASDRILLYRKALESFTESPLLGKETSVSGEEAYPHNLFVESLMATGLAGTIPLCILVIYALRCSWRILVRCPSLGWIPLNFYVYLGCAQFSGAIYLNSALWISMAGTIAAAQWIAKTTPIPRPLRTTDSPYQEAFA